MSARPVRKKRILGDQPLGRMGKGRPKTCVPARYPTPSMCYCLSLPPKQLGSAPECIQVRYPHLGLGRGTVCGLCTCCSFHLACPSSSSPTKAVTLPVRSLPHHLEPRQSRSATLLEATCKCGSSSILPSQGAGSPRARLCPSHPRIPRAPRGAAAWQECCRQTN